MRLISLFFLLIVIATSYCQDSTKNITHSPRKSTILSLCIPSAGQFYNHFNRENKKKKNLWWKLPIIYGGLGTSVYFVIDNQNEFSAIKNERLQRLNTGQSNLYPLYTSSQLKLIQNDYRRWRDLSVISILGVYLLQVIDANIEGHLIHFDNSDNLSININPNFNSNNFKELQLSIHYRF
jgi:hypothetical protein